jgi:acyl carrier protein
VALSQDSAGASVGRMCCVLADRNTEVLQPLPISSESAMAEDNLREAIKSMMIENLMLKVSKEEIRDDMPLFGPEGLGLDSIDALELVVGLEKRFGVSVPNSETARQALATVNSIHDYIAANRK